MEMYYQQIAEKSLPTLPVPSTDDEIVVRFPPKPAEAAPVSDAPSTPPQGDQKPVNSTEAPAASPEPSKPAEQPKAEEKK
jgi:hypothetical protein